MVWEVLWRGNHKVEAQKESQTYEWENGHGRPLWGCGHLNENQRWWGIEQGKRKRHSKYG